MVIGQLANLADVSRAKLEELLNDLGRRLQAAGMSLVPVYIVQRSIAADLGDRALRAAAKNPFADIFATAKENTSGHVEEIETEIFLARKKKPFVWPNRC